ncbi:MAG: hypothetical protein RJB66_950 [Pseudomonadota bacterium]
MMPVFGCVEALCSFSSGRKRKNVRQPSNRLLDKMFILAFYQFETLLGFGLQICLVNQWMIRTLFILLILVILFGIEFPIRAESVPLYDMDGRLACMVPSGVRFQALAASDEFDNYTHVRLPMGYSNRCGREGLVPTSKIKSLSSTPTRPQWDLSLLPSAEQKKRVVPVSRIPDDSIEGDDDSEIDSDDVEQDDDDAIEELNGGRSIRESKPRKRGVRQNPQSNGHGSLETESRSECLDCQNISDPLREIKDIGDNTYHHVSKPMCEAQGYEASRSKVPVKGRMQEVLAQYSQRAKGAIRRAYLALVPPKGTRDYERVRKVTKNFQDFESVDPLLLKSLLRKSNRDCYKFVKAALSNDYSVLSRYNRSRGDYRRSPLRRANVELVGSFCGNDTGDLTEKHWLNTAVGAGTAGPHLKERGFINLMDSEWGVSQRFKTESSAPEGAVLVYKCASRGRIVSSSKCYGDIAIKSKNGYLRDFFTPHSITTSGKRVLVGIYIKPGGPG